MHPSGMNVSPAADWSVNVRILIESISSSVSASELQFKLRYWFLLRNSYVINLLDFTNSSTIISFFKPFSSIYRHVMKKIDFCILQDFIFFNWLLLITFQMANWCWRIVADWQPKCLALQSRNHFTSTTTICDYSNASRGWKFLKFSMIFFSNFWWIFFLKFLMKVIFNLAYAYN